ncbi:MAG: phosphoribosylaminoimidazolesuccinocarboxamide synthase [Rickettsiales bacterium]|nr:phosphoribosylaminoimidazolesuccinocarboxamide synthase [Pseudomonadota bacterium]MDA0966115.1 phosphoribosylaminoimidazolesuccinocarboxamide synthase [Pseudomonadota bacterium]MDG4543220.1 phosphoribosylaminoimidazolesuccinocarboxamide synthase [Rickettsiales bacterium]MDG4545418.1 phosphoribosylaminoimidazolesuccinocarboxamide synthase [Rickettsiales bacterium]MDG4547867.1 phosphoribosylaminoimidazolesuccinocarboxamide synthase [Rickettsiales bacterium]
MAPRRTKKQIYEGKAKVLFEGPRPGTIIQYFKDDATAFNNKKKDVISGKGVLNNRISEFIMLKLKDVGIPTHFIKRLNMREQLVRQVDIIPLEVIVRNVAAGSLSTRLGIEEGTELSKPLLEFCYKDDKLNDPLVSDEHILTFGWADPIELDEIKNLALRINDILFGMFAGVGIRLIDFKIEFGRIQDEEEGYVEILLADEISPDSCRLWDAKTNKKLDKDRFRRDMGDVAEAYQEVARRLGIFIDHNKSDDEENI